jgi:hypothetical protein
MQQDVGHVEHDALLSAFFLLFEPIVNRLHAQLCLYVRTRLMLYVFIFALCIGDAPVTNGSMSMSFAYLHALPVSTSFTRARLQM